METELVADWCEDLRHPIDYKEPILDNYTVAFLKQACDTFKQDDHVFAMSIEVLESYIRAKDETNTPIKNEALVACVCIFTCSKYVGEDVALRIKHIETFVKKATENPMVGTSIFAVELDILRTLNGKLPITSKVDDLNTVVEKFVKDTNLRTSILPLSREILQLVFVKWKELFFDLKAEYDQNDESAEVFIRLMKRRIYLPLGVLVCSLQLTNYKYIFNINNILDSYSSISKIHSDHINILASKILAILKS